MNPEIRQTQQISEIPQLPTPESSGLESGFPSAKLTVSPEHKVGAPATPVPLAPVIPSSSHVPAPVGSADHSAQAPTSTKTNKKAQQRYIDDVRTLAKQLADDPHQATWEISRRRASYLNDVYNRSVKVV